MAKKLYYKIGEACKSLDIQPYVLRYWETEFPALKPNKSKSGQRVYSEQDLVVIRRIKELLYDEGYTIAGAKKKLDSEDFATSDRGEAEAKEAAAEPAAPEPAAAPAKPEPKPKPKAKAKKPAAAKKKPVEKAPAAAAPEAPAGLSKDAREGIQKALDETREILALLDKADG